MENEAEGLKVMSQSHPESSVCWDCDTEQQNPMYWSNHCKPSASILFTDCSSVSSMLLGDVGTAKINNITTHNIVAPWNILLPPSHLIYLFKHELIIFKSYKGT